MTPAFTRRSTCPLRGPQNGARSPRAGAGSGCPDPGTAAGDDVGPPGSVSRASRASSSAAQGLGPRRPVPVVRRGDHVLAAPGDGVADRGRAGGVEEGPDGDLAAVRIAGATGDSDTPSTPEYAWGAEALRGDGPDESLVGRFRRHPLGRAHLPRPHRVRDRLRARGPAAGPVHGSSRSSISVRRGRLPDLTPPSSCSSRCPRLTAPSS